LASVVTGDQRPATVITGDVVTNLFVFAFDRDGQLLADSNGAAWKGSYPAHGQLLYSDGRVYHLNAHGRLACLDAADADRCGPQIPASVSRQDITWALSECLLVDHPA